MPESYLTYAVWQGLLGLLFVSTFTAWAWSAFVRPSTFGMHNAKRYAKALFRTVLKGSPEELAVIADEIERSAKSLIRYATDWSTYPYAMPGESLADYRTDVEAYADEILSLIADKRLCRTIVASASGTALSLFREVAEAKKYGIALGTFGRNITSAALADRNSYLYHESEGHSSGLLGYYKPLSQAIYGTYEMVRGLEELLDVDRIDNTEWSAAELEAYCRIVLMAFKSYVDGGYGGHSAPLYRAMKSIERATWGLYKIDGGSSNAWNEDVVRCLSHAASFIKKAIKLLDVRGYPKNISLRASAGGLGTFYDHLAMMVFQMAFFASKVRGPRDLCWTIQHNLFWGELFNFDQLNGPAARVVKFKARRLLFNEIKRMETFPNFMGGSLLGLCLNVMGLTYTPEKSTRDTDALHKAILRWTQKHFVKLYANESRGCSFMSCRWN